MYRPAGGEGDARQAARAGAARAPPRRPAAASKQGQRPRRGDGRRSVCRRRAGFVSTRTPPRRRRQVRRTQVGRPASGGLPCADAALLHCGAFPPMDRRRPSPCPPVPPGLTARVVAPRSACGACCRRLARAAAPPPRPPPPPGRAGSRGGVAAGRERRLRPQGGGAGEPGLHPQRRAGPAGPASAAARRAAPRVRRRPPLPEVKLGPGASEPEPPSRAPPETLVDETAIDTPAPPPSPSKRPLLRLWGPRARPRQRERARPSRPRPTAAPAGGSPRRPPRPAAPGRPRRPRPRRRQASAGHGPLPAGAWITCAAAATTMRWRRLRAFVKQHPAARPGRQRPVLAGRVLLRSQGLLARCASSAGWPRSSPRATRSRTRC